jgi:hypothetical protein
MKKYLVLFILMVGSTTVFSQSALFSTYLKMGYDSVSKQTYVPDMNFSGQRMLSEHWGVFGFCLVEQKTAKAYGGVVYSPAKWVKLRVGIGLEQKPSLYRLAAGALFNFDKFTIFLAGERGKDDVGKPGQNYWYRASAKYQVKNWELGVISWRYHATGLWLGYAPTKWLNIWTVPGYDFRVNAWRVVVGLDTRI